MTRAFLLNRDEPRQLPTIYTNSLIDYAKKNLEFVKTIEKQLTQLARNVQASDRRMEFYEFEAMDFDRRIILHKLATYYGIKAQAMGIEPYRKVIVCASCDISKPPVVTLSQTIEQ